MSRVCNIDDKRVVIICAEAAQKCELCGVEEETRPYGPSGKQICWDCGQKDPAGTQKRLEETLFGNSDGYETRVALFDQEI